MDLIDAQELKAKLDRGDDFKFVMTLGEWEYRTTHIPGSVRISTIEEALEELDPNDEIILYDSGPGCPASRMALRTLKARGYGRVRRYAGGSRSGHGQVTRLPAKAPCNRNRATKEETLVVPRDTGLHTEPALRGGVQRPNRTL